ncbi:MULTISPECIES: preprotein translocase subunit SecA [Chryseobacterium]|jgi:preprotein translocase subunit SecA|uniref:Protein translocase subunit SecA n=1 Tax=Chryseobacterium nepalense TaxID=1854498 RepID=A0ABY4K4M6_9FLAO|nr:MULTISPECIES: preprotein translocase subunit SecA [Chryseobacterium]MEA1850811.1 preprotein translocase subunit SecA [Chryseobacterium sp. MHB01]MEC5172734.1 preprotein translocase subunit SecA [Chryseobacterium nepalense]UPQ74723.1 preprotein translocase subunit SecA [Chryseobacterium nepalense]
MSFLNKVLKGFLGDKKAQDLKEVKKVVTKIKAVEPNIQQLSDDGLREKTAEFKENIKSATGKITAQIEQIQEQIKNSKNVDEKEALFSKIEALKKESYEIEEKVLGQILPEAFALVKETARRWAQNGEIRVTATDWDRQLAAAGKDFLEIQGDQAVWKNSWNAAGTPVNWDMVHYDVQFIGGVILHSGKIAEMATGEGKTLVGTLPIFLNALPGRGVHVVTVNDYLAKRDSAWMGPLYQFHGMSIDCIDNHQPNSDGRRKAYNSDITYGTNNEFGFDYLRDNMVTSPSELVQRELNFAIVDEVDSVLVDDARTPLIISGPVPQGDRQEFDVLKPSIDRIVEVQKKTVSAIFNEAKKLIAAGNTKEGGFKLLQAYRGLPKNRQLIKFLSESGNRALLQKVEAQYMQDNNRDMPIVDKDLYFVIEEKNNQVDLTDKGVEYMSQGNSDPNFFVLPDIGTEIAELEAKNLSKEEEFEAKEKLFSEFAEKSERVHTMSQLLKAYTLFEKDDEYVVIDGEVKIVDEQTGRIMEGRRYSDGLHQAIEAKESVKIEAATQTFATITLQNYFRMYNKLAGMTGTAETEAGELWEIYKLDVVVIPTNRPILRNDKQDLVYKTNREKYNAVIEEVEKLTAAGRPVLVGTTSVEISQLLSKALQLRKINHQVLNAKLHKKEAEIVAGAGQPGVVTIATNMAGRGTDIKLSKEVKEAGGLAIIGTERHDSRRVDRQLRGRAGRQGDPGSSQFYVSLEDNLMRLFGSERIAKMMDRMGHKEGEVIQHSMISKSIERAQKKVEENNFGTRKRLLEYDDVMNKQRDVIYKRRKNALFGDHLKYDITNMIFDVSNSIVAKGKASGNYKDFEYEIIKTFTMESPVSENDFKSKTIQDLTNILFKAAQEDYQMKLNLLKEKSFPIIENVYQNQGSMFKMIQVPFTDGHKTMTIVTDLKEAFETQCDSLINDFEKNITLSIIDENWKLHLREMDDLRRSSQGAVYEQKDPLVIYKQESFHLFSEMIDKLNKEIISFLYKGEIPA